MRTQADELCHSCRRKTNQMGQTIEEMLDSYYNDERTRKLRETHGDFGANAMILNIVMNDNYHCTRCAGLLLNRSKRF